MTSARSVMARKSVVVRLTPKQAMVASHQLSRAAMGHDGATASRLFSASSAINSALCEDGWELDEDGTWTKEVER